MFSELVANFALLFALAVAYRLARPRWSGTGWSRSLGDGVLFGAFAVAVMSMPHTVAEGVVFDSRSIVLSICGLFCGPAAALVAALPAMAFRIWTGGAGALTGCVVIGVSAAIGVCAHYARRRKPEVTSSLGLLLFGFVVHAALLLAMQTLPASVRSGTLTAIALPVMTLYPAATFLLGRLLLSEEEERAVRERLAASESLLREALDAASAGIVICDGEGRIVRTNPSFRALTGREDADLLGRPLLTLLRPEDPGDAPVALADLPPQASRLCDRPDGARAWVSATATTVDAGGGRLRHVVVVEDLSRVRRDRREIARLGAAVDQVGEGVIITSSDGTIEYANAAFERLTGWPPAEVLGKNPRLLRNERTPPRVFEHLWSTVTQGRSWRGRIWNTRRDGSEFLAELTVSPATDESGEVVRYVGVQRDITEEVRAERLRRQRHKMDAMARLAGDVAHDLNNLLTVIGGAGELALRAAEEGAPRRSQIEEILRATGRASAMTRQLLAFSRRRKPKLRPVDVGGLVSGLLGRLGRLVGGDVEIDVFIEPDLAPAAADAEQLEQALTNLVVNAGEAMPEGGDLHIAVAAAPEGGGIVIEVRDTGVGIAESELERVFEPFHSTKPGHDGLGLATTYGIVTGFGGEIGVESEPGAGSTFRIVLPFHEDVERDAARGGAGAPGTVLVVEDDPAVRALVGAVLGTAGHRVLQAADARGALDVAASHDGPIDVLLADVVLPDGDGRSLALGLRTGRERMQVLLMSGHPADVIARHVDDASALLQKPLAHDVLLRRVEQAVAAARPRA